MGSWISYGLGSMNDNLPTSWCAARSSRLSIERTKNWSSAFLPAHSQGTTIFPQRDVPIEAAPQVGLRDDGQRPRWIALLSRLNRTFEQQRPGDSRLDARIKTYELAAKMQLSAPEALDLSQEPQHILKMYGLETAGLSYGAEINAPEEAEYFGRKCLIARRLLERGCGSCRSGQAMTTASRAATGTATKTSSAIMVRSRGGWLSERRP